MGQLQVRVLPNWGEGEEWVALRVGMRADWGLVLIAAVHDDILSSFPGLALPTLVQVIELAQVQVHPVGQHKLPPGLILRMHPEPKLPCGIHHMPRWRSCITMQEVTSGWAVKHV